MSEAEQLGRSAERGRGLLSERPSFRADHQAVGDHVPPAQVCHLAYQSASKWVTSCISHTYMTLGMSCGMPAFHALMRRRACYLASLHFVLVYNTGHVMWHVCTWRFVKLGHSTWCVICSFADSFFACVCISVVAD